MAGKLIVPAAKAAVKKDETVAAPIPLRALAAVIVACCREPEPGEDFIELKAPGREKAQIVAGLKG